MVLWTARDSHSTGYTEATVEGYSSIYALPGDKIIDDRTEGGASDIFRSSARHPTPRTRVAARTIHEALRSSRITLVRFGRPGGKGRCCGRIALQKGRCG